MFSTRAFLSLTSLPSSFALNFKSAFMLSFSGKSPPQWISSHLLNQALLSLLVPSFVSEIGPDIINLFTDTMNKSQQLSNFGCRSTRLRLVNLQHFDNVMTKFIINKRTDA